MLEQLKIDKEFTQDQIDQMSDSFIRYLLEMVNIGVKIEESHMASILEIVLIKYGTNIELLDDLVEVVSALKELDDLDSVLKQFPDNEVQKAYDQIKLALKKVEEQIQKLMKEDEYASISNNESASELS